MIFHGPRAGLNAELACPSSRDASPASASPVFPGPGCRPAAEAAQGRQGKYEPVLVRPPTLLRGTIMPGRHSVKRKKAERAEHRGVAEVVDARTLRAHLLTP